MPSDTRGSASGYARNADVEPVDTKALCRRVSWKSDDTLMVMGIVYVKEKQSTHLHTFAYMRNVQVVCGNSWLRLVEAPESALRVASDSIVFRPAKQGQGQTKELCLKR